MERLDVLVTVCWHWLAVMLCGLGFPHTFIIIVKHLGGWVGGGWWVVVGGGGGACQDESMCVREWAYVWRL